MKRTSLAMFLAVLIVSAGCSVDRANEVVLSVAEPGADAIGLTRADLSRFARTTVSAKEKDGNISEFEGIELVEILRAANIPLGDELRGKEMTTVLVAEATDGYKVTFTLAELDPAFSGIQVLVADKRDGAPLSEKEGELRFVVPSETNRQARWIRNVVSIKVMRLE